MAAQRASSEPAAREMRKRKGKRETGQRAGERGRGGERRGTNKVRNDQYTGLMGTKKKRFFFRGGAWRRRRDARDMGEGRRGELGVVVEE